MNPLAQRQSSDSRLEPLPFKRLIYLPKFPQVRGYLTLKTGLSLFSLFEAINLFALVIASMYGLTAALYLGGLIHGLTLTVIYALRHRFFVHRTATVPQLEVPETPSDFCLLNLGYIISSDPSWIVLRSVSSKPFLKDLALVRIKSPMVPKGISYRVSGYRNDGIIETVTIVPREQDSLAAKWHIKLRNHLRSTGDSVHAVLDYSTGERQELHSFGKYRPI